MYPPRAVLHLCSKQQLDNKQSYDLMVSLIKLLGCISAIPDVIKNLCQQNSAGKNKPQYAIGYTTFAFGLYYSALS